MIISGGGFHDGFGLSRKKRAIWLDFRGWGCLWWQALIFSGDTEKPVSYVDSFFAEPDTGARPYQHR
jgi:hypothetical protein